MPPSREDLVYRALRSAAGEGGYAENETASIDALIRRTRAAAIASVIEQGLRTAEQVLPSHATDLLAYYERLLGLPPEDPDLTESERQQLAARLYTLRRSGDVPSMRAALREIDARFDVLVAEPETALVTIAGRAFEDYAASEPFEGGRESTAWPNFSDHSVLAVVLELGDGVAANAAELRAIKLARQIVDDVLPATHAFHVITHVGFALDQSLLDVTGLDA